MFISDKFDEIKKEFDCSKNSHSYIFYTNDFFSCQKDVIALVKHIFNENNLNKIQSDFVVIKKSDKKQILKDDMVELKSFFQKTSYINNNRIYLIEEVQKLNSTSANMILKFLEEPMKGVIAFFITDNLDAVLPTIKSRCQVVNTFYGDSKEIDNGNKEYLELNKVLFVDNKYYSLLKIKKKYEKKERSELIIMFKDLLEYYYNLDFNKENISRIKLLNESINLLNCNVNTDYVFDYVLLGGLNV